MIDIMDSPCAVKILCSICVLVREWYETNPLGQPTRLSIIEHNLVLILLQHIYESLNVINRLLLFNHAMSIYS